ncbi:MAG: bifunctional DedA family/phosphatase PAP2 family protein [bacterium]
MQIEKTIIEFLYNNKFIFEEFGLFIAFFSSLVESIPIIGFIIPGQTLLVIAAIFARLGAYNIWELIALAALGSFLGDAVGYFLGRKYSNPILQKMSKFISQEKIDKTKDLTVKHAGKAVFVGRFNSFTRSFSPFFAGLTNISKPKFFFYAFTASVVWATSFSALGYIIGEGVTAIIPSIGKFVAIATVIALLIIYMAEKARLRGGKFTKKQIALFITSIISLYAFAAIAQNITDHGSLSIIDQQIGALVASWRNPMLLSSLWWLGYIGPWTFTLICLVPMIVLLLLRRFRDLSFFTVSLALSGALVVFLKAEFSRPRPFLHFLFKESSSSFPSGHALLAVVFFGLICYEARNYLKEWQFILLCSFSSIMILLVGFSRIYFGVHWASDVIGGFCFGIFFVSTALLVFDVLPHVYKRIIIRK